MKEALDRMDVPTVFYTPKTADNNSHTNAFGRVFAESSDHFRSDWITVGYVSKQTPFGQGTFLGFERSELREAMREEVLTALRIDHPHGRDFRPFCREAMGASFHLALSRTFRNWTNDDPGGSPPIHDVSRNDIQKFGETAAARHNKLMRKWWFITWRQRLAIKSATI